MTWYRHSVYGNEHKKALLGMPHGTAQHRLWKQLFFRMLQETGRDTCFRCKEKLTHWQDYSLDHCKAWQSQPELFWDLENIAFSHKKCNYRSLETRVTGAKLRKIGAKGTHWCIGHQMFLKDDLFYSNKHRWNGVNSYCKDCTKKGKKEKHYERVAG